MSRLKSLLWTFFLLALAPSLIAQSSCPTIVEQALQTLDQICASTGRNQACYGNISLQAEPQPGTTDFKFSAVGDIENVTDLLSLKLEPMDETAGTWGVVMMNLQANLPDTLPGQNVTFLLFGDVELTNAVETDSELRPMQAFYLKTGIGDAPCAEAPDSGMLVQTPKGVGEVTFNVNGVDVAMGSTVLFRTSSENEMRVVTLEGSAALKVQDKVVPVIKGTAAEVPAYSEELMLFEAPSAEEAAGDSPAPASVEPYELELEPFNDEDIEGLPFDTLLRDIDEEIEPLSDEEYEALMERIENDEPLCGVEGLPSCDQVIPELGGEMCVLPEFADEGDVICEGEELYLEQGCIGNAESELTEELEGLPFCEDILDETDDIDELHEEEPPADQEWEDDGSWEEPPADQEWEDDGSWEEPPADEEWEDEGEDWGE